MNIGPPSRAPRPNKRRSQLNSFARFVVAFALFAGSPIETVLANDRPFQVARTAVKEDDDDRSWSFESWIQRLGAAREVSIEPEYTFGGGRSVQVELGRLVDRDAKESGHEGEVEFKQLFNRVDSEGWAWGISAAAGIEHSRSEGTVRHLNIKIPISIALGSHGYLHLDPGLDRASGTRFTFAPSAAIQYRLTERIIGFVEHARQRGSRFEQIGLRHWAKGEKLAVDFALQQRRINGRRQTGFIIGLGIYDF